MITLIYDLRDKERRHLNEIESLRSEAYPAGFVYEPKTVELSQLFEEAQGDGTITNEDFVDFLISDLEKLKEVIEVVERYKSDKTYLASHLLTAKPAPAKKESSEIIGSPAQYIGHILKDPNYGINAMVMEYVPEKNLVIFKRTNRGVIIEGDNGFAYTVDSFTQLVISHILRVISPHLRKQQINITRLTVLEVGENDVEYTVKAVSEKNNYILGITKEKVIFQNIE